MAANFTQENRFISITTPLGPDKLLLRSFSGTEAISKMFTFQAELLSEDHSIDINNILGKKVTVALNLPEKEGGQRYFNGYVNRFKQLPGIDRFARYQAEMVPWLWLLTQTTDCRIFQKESVPDIVEKIFQQFEFQDFKRELQRNYQACDYRVQYRESACNFVMRLLETEGIFFFFRHEKNRHILVMADSPSAHKPLEPMKITYEYVAGLGYQQEESRINSWLIDHTLRTGRYAVKDFNFEAPSSSLLVNIDSRIKVGDNQAYELYDYPGGYEKRDEGDKYVRMRMEEEEVEHATIQAEGNCRHFNSGFLFELTGHNRRDQNKQYLLTSVLHDISIGGNFSDNTGAEDHHYRNRFICIPYSVPFRPGRHTPKRIIQGTQTAKVVGPKGEEIHTDKYGRIKVQFHWDRYGKMDENSSCWIRVSQVHAGKGFGAIDIPRIGEEVIVEFLEGDPDRPIITGRIYNGENKPPTDLPKAGMQSGIKSNTTPGGGGNNSIILDDTKQKEKVSIHAQYNMDSTIQNDLSTTVVKGNETHKVDTGTQTITIKGNATITVQEGDRIINVTGNYKCDTTNQINLQAPSKMTLTCGGSVITMEPTKISLQAGGGASLTLDTNATMSSPAEATVEAALKSTLTGGGSTTVADATGVSVTGIKISLNG